ncbi:MAG: ferrous iron transport protein B, partial [Isosphaeraceae bacterium]
LLVDLPGTYSLAPRSPDEIVAIDVLLGRQPDLPPPDIIVCVVAANNIERNLYFLSQILELGRPVVVALTMNDLAATEGIRIDTSGLARRLGVPIVPIHARRGEGLDQLKAAVNQAAKARTVPASPEIFPEVFRQEAEQLQAAISGWANRSGSSQLPNTLPRFLVERRLLDAGVHENRWFSLGGDYEAELNHLVEASRQRLAAAGCRVPEIETVSRYQWVARQTAGLIETPEEIGLTTTDRLDSVLTHRLWGSLVLAAVLIVMFSAVFSWAQWPMGWIESVIGSISSTVESLLPEGALRSLLTDGVIGGVGSVVIFLPQIFILFFLMTALEECGYMARAAYLMDRIMLRFGLSGRSFIPLLSSFACAIPGIMATRVIENRRDRLTTILIAPLMSCSARLPVYTLMIAAFIPQKSLFGGILQLQGVTLFSMYLVGVVVAAAMAWILKRTILKGDAPMFVMEMPAYQRPSLRVIIARVLERSLDFLQNAGTIIFAVSIVMWGALYYPRTSPEASRELTANQARLEASLEAARAGGEDAKVGEMEDELGEIESKLAGIQQRNSFLGRAGRLIEPFVKPLGWDWRIGSA